MQAPVPPHSPGALNKIKDVLVPPRWEEMFGRASLGNGNRLGNNGQTHSFKREMWSMMILALLGLVLGLCTNAMFGVVFQKMTSKWKKFLWSLLQLITLALMTFSLYYFLPQSFTGTFQGTYPGMMFAVFFYGTQTNMFNGLKSPFGNIMG
jgi:ABC-type glycerol-3-phosphate transport system permease component